MAAPWCERLSLVVGLFLFALGIVLQLQSELGLSPWDVLNQGVSERTSLSFGTANIVIAVVVLAIAWALGARIGVGTVANAVLIGLFVDGLLDLDAVDSLTGHGSRSGSRCSSRASRSSRSARASTWARRSVPAPGTR